MALTLQLIEMCFVRQDVPVKWFKSAPNNERQLVPDDSWTFKNDFDTYRDKDRWTNTLPADSYKDKLVY